MVQQPPFSEIRMNRKTYERVSSGNMLRDGNTLDTSGCSAAYAARIRIRVSVSEGYGYADTAISQTTRYADTFLTILLINR